MDPGIPVGGAPTLQGEVLTYRFARFSHKLREIKNILVRRGHALEAPPLLGSTTGNNVRTWSVLLDGEAEGEESLLIGLSREKTFVTQNMMLESGKMSQMSPFYPESALRGIKQTEGKT